MLKWGTQTRINGETENIETDFIARWHFEFNTICIICEPTVISSE